MGENSTFPACCEGSAITTGQTKVLAPSPASRHRQLLTSPLTSQTAAAVGTRWQPVWCALRSTIQCARMCVVSGSPTLGDSKGSRSPGEGQAGWRRSDPRPISRLNPAHQPGYVQLGLLCSAGIRGRRLLALFTRCGVWTVGWASLSFNIPGPGLKGCYHWQSGPRRMRTPCSVPEVPCHCGRSTPTLPV